MMLALPATVAWTPSSQAGSIAMGSEPCVKMPWCADPSQSCLTDKDTVFEIMPECLGMRHNVSFDNNPLCGRSMYA